MKYSISLITMLLLISGCQSDSSYKSPSQKVQYDLINEVLNQYIFIPSGDDVRPVGYSGCVFQLMPGSDQMDLVISMVEKTKDPISDEDRGYMKWQLEQSWNKKINNSLIDSYYITVIKDREMDLQELCNSMLLFLSPPFFSVDKQHAVIWQSMEYKGFSAGFLLTMEKQKNRWVMVSYDMVE